MKYTYIKAYKGNDKIRKSLSELAKKNFCLSFEDWYSNGFWGDLYIPYSLLDNDKVIANVSVNLMHFTLDGIEKHYIQIGTVMTDENYRNQGLGRYLMEKVIEEYKENVDGIYLFANNSALDFYPKFGFRESKEYQYVKDISSGEKIKKVQQVNVSDKTEWECFFNAVKNGIENDRFTMHNPGLVAFWAKWSTSVYYLAEEDSYIVADVDGDKLFLKQIIADHKVETEKIISSFGSNIKKVALGFTPYDAEGYTLKEHRADDCTLFIMGKDLECIQNQKLTFPTLSHA